MVSLWENSEKLRDFSTGQQKHSPFYPVSHMDYLTTVEMSKRWNISSRRIGVLCTEGRIEGAIKKGKMWLIPSDAVKPVDGRFKVNKVEA